MTVQYSYNFNEFLNSNVNLEKLTGEIVETEALSGSTLHGIHTVDNSICNITFVNAISSESTLSAIVSAHDGTPYAPAELTFQAERINTFTSTASAYTEVLSLSASIPQGNYRLQWFTLYGIDSGLVNFKMRITQDDEEIPLMGYTEEVPNADPDERIPRSGFIPLNLEKGDHHFDLECGKESGGEEAWRIFKAFLELRNLEE